MRLNITTPSQSTIPDRVAGDASWTRGANPPPTATIVILAVGLVASALALATLVAVDRATRHAKVAGACLALDMAAAHGVLDDPTYRRVLRALSEGIDPFHDRLPGSYRELLATCAALRQGR